MLKPLTYLLAIGAIAVPIACQDTCPEQAATVSALHVRTTRSRARILSVADHQIYSMGFLCSFSRNCSRTRQFLPIKWSPSRLYQIPPAQPWSDQMWIPSIRPSATMSVVVIWKSVFRKLNQTDTGVQHFTRRESSLCQFLSYH